MLITAVDDKKSAEIYFASKILKNRYSFGREGDNEMANIDLGDILGIVDSGKGEIICRDCMTEEEVFYIAEEEAITKDKILKDDSYQCNRCNKQL